MRINKLHLENFKNFESASFRFNPNFTVIIGRNGTGKSSIIQGLRLAAATFLLGIDEAERYHIQKEDVRRIDIGNRFVPQKKCSFEAQGELNEEKVTWKRTLSRVGGRTDYKEAYDLIGIAESLNRQVNEELRDDVDLPIIGYFNTARLWVDSYYTVKLKKKGARLQDGYARCVDDRTDKKSPMEWIKSATWKKLKNKPDSVLLDAVLEAIDICIPNWQPSEWDEDTDDLGGHYSGENHPSSFVPLSYLSDGLKTMGAMVAEVAYRCVILNPHHGREAVKKSKGIVLIDEIDMHLHPEWQRQVVGDLKRAFPNIQFIATTHSPFIVQSLDSDELINLDLDIDEAPYKLNLQDVASAIMKVDTRSEKYAEQYNKAEKYLKALDELPNASDDEKQKLKETMEKIENATDPAFAAFLKMNKLAKLGNTQDS